MKLEPRSQQKPETYRKNLHNDDGWMSKKNMGNHSSSVCVKEENGDGLNSGNAEDHVNYSALVSY